MWQVWGRREIHAVCWCGNMKEGDHLEGERMILKWVLKEVEWDDTDTQTGFT